MKVLLNGRPQEVDDGTTVAALVELAGAPSRGVAVAVDGVILPRTGWGSAAAEGSAVEVLTAVQGG